MKSLYTNVPLKEAIEIALQKLYSQESLPKIQRAIIKRLSSCRRKVTYRSKWVECECCRNCEVRPNQQFTLEETNSKGNLPFLDLNINVSQDRGVNCNWYQKPTNKGTIEAALQLSVSVVLSKALSPEFFGVHFSGSKLIRLWKLKRRMAQSPSTSSTQSPKDVKPSMLMVPYRGNQIQYFSSRLQILTKLKWFSPQKKT